MGARCDACATPAQRPTPARRPPRSSLAPLLGFSFLSFLCWLLLVAFSWTPISSWCLLVPVSLCPRQFGCRVVVPVSPGSDLPARATLSIAPPLRSHLAARLLSLRRSCLRT